MRSRFDWKLLLFILQNIAMAFIPAYVIYKEVTGKFKYDLVFAHVLIISFIFFALIPFGVVEFLKGRLGRDSKPVAVYSKFYFAYSLIVMIVIIALFGLSFKIEALNNASFADTMLFLLLYGSFCCLLYLFSSITISKRYFPRIVGTRIAAGIFGILGLVIFAVPFVFVLIGN